jgi:hypothetical protein
VAVTTSHHSAPGLKPALDEIGATATVGRAVDDSDDPVDPLAVEDAFAGPNRVTGQLDRLAQLVAVAPGFDDRRIDHDRPLQVALAGAVGICRSRECSAPGLLWWW